MSSDESLTTSKVYGMTRETKIGLLVGLAFIIVIGILLSEYNRIDTQPAPLTAVADNVRAGAATPHNDSTQDESVAPPVLAAPVRTVPTRDELHGQTQVEVGPGPDAPSRDHPVVRLDPPVTTTPMVNPFAPPAGCAAGPARCRKD